MQKFMNIFLPSTLDFFETCFPAEQSQSITKGFQLEQWKHYASSPLNNGLSEFIEKTCYESKI